VSLLIEVHADRFVEAIRFVADNRVVRH